MTARARSFALLAALGLAFAATPASAATAGPAVAEARAALQQAVSRADVDAILAARGAFVALQADAPDDPALACWIALCCWRAEPLLLPRDKAAARRLCVEGIAACDRAAAADPALGEAYALKASLQALSLAFVPEAAMTLGPEMEENFARARELSPKDPRVQLLAGVYALHKPERYRGGPVPAKPLLERAVALFAAGGATVRGLDWGRDDALLWSGRCAAQLGDWATARERFRRVLAVNPDHRWVRDRLLPEAESHVTAPADSAR